MTSIRTVIVEGQPIFLQGVLTDLQEYEEINVLGTAATGQEGIDLIRETKPDVATAAIELPDMSGIALLEEVSDLVPVIVLTSQESRDVIYEAMRCGARGYLLKWNREIPIAHAIREVASGKHVLGTTSLNSLFAALRERNARGRKKHDILSDREREVLTLISQGKSQKDVAKELGLGQSTVRSHCRNAYLKLRVRNQASAIREALRLELISDQDPIVTLSRNRGASQTSSRAQRARERPSESP